MSVRLSLLIPGRADEFVSCAQGHGTVWQDIAKKIQHSRSAIYVGIALIAIGAVGLAIANAPLVFVFAGTACLGLIVTAVAAKKFYSATAAVLHSYQSSELTPKYLPSVAEINDDLNWSDNEHRT
jgi:hypothetical protein